MRKTLPGRARGFTLIEMIAAFVIFAIAVGALMQILTMSMNNARRSADETRAALWAQTLLDNVGVGERVEAGSSHGEFDRSYRWEMQIDQIDPELVVANASEPSGNPVNAAPAVAAGAALLPQIDLFHVVLTVIWGDGSHERQAQFSTLRTANADPNHPGGMSGADLSGGRRDRGMSTERAGQSGKPAGRGQR
ncbi:type IV pilus modification PilV family protein [Dokdonella immobilis]|uniref:General secretion pathway protein I n=1 Tax=Dokdonella immobilis TaxID=578942 RepID=A0A1I4WV36_9GAMM|nr:type II secretion system protein [Dokdonella immobilis]SFN17325.1 general secretion pathway protein I [Dokdonella immobilis]